MEHKKTIEVLNKLIEVNNVRIEGYETALIEIDEPDFKSLFFQFVQTSMSCKQELSNEIYKLGGIPTEGTKHTGKFVWKWLDEKADLSATDCKAILSSCKYSEKQAIEIYKNVLTEDLKHLSLFHQSMIRNQYWLLKSSRNTVKLMCLVLV